jgi:MFS family permease
MSEITMERKPILNVFSNRNFLLLWIGGSTSVLGSQFSIIALPWLMLQLTGDPLALGMVLALAGIPRAVFMLVGGAISDRFSPRNILLICDWLNFFLTGLAAALVFFGMMQVWMLYIFSLVTGLLSGFVIPAANSIVPTLVPEEDLQAGNSITMGSSQLAGFLGPALAGTLIGAYAQSSLGIAIALGVDAITFGFSALMLGLIHSKQPLATRKNEIIWDAIRNGWNYLWNHIGIRFMFVLMAAINFLFVGPILVGIPVLADQRLPEGARAFGFLMSAFAGGNLVGLVLAGTLPKLSGRLLSGVIIGVLAAFGLVLVSLGWLNSTTTDIILMGVIGIGNGYISLVIFTWIQLRTPKDMLGRIMSMLMLASMGLVPLSQAISGAVSKWNLTGLFILSGGLILLMTFWAAFQPTLRSLSEEMLNG